MSKDRLSINKTDFIAKYAEINGLSKRQAGDEVENFLTALYKTLAAGNGVKFPGFGIFTLQYCKPVAGQQNFGAHAGEPLIVPERYRLTFKVSDALKNDIRMIAVE